MTPGAAVAAAYGFALSLARVGGFVSAAPILGDRALPSAARAALALALAVFFNALQAPPPLPAGAGLLVWNFSREALLGLGLGVFLRVSFLSLLSAGHLIDAHAGFSSASIFNPLMGLESSVLADFLAIVGTLVFLGVDGHHWLFAALGQTFRLAPLGGALPGAGGLFASGVALFSAHVELAWRLAAPFILALLMMESVFFFLNRMAPQMNVLVLGMPLRFLLTFGLLAATLDVSARFWLTSVESSWGAVPALLARLVHG